MPALETAGLTKYYGGTRGIEDLDLRVEEGEVLGFSGPNRSASARRTNISTASPSGDRAMNACR
jgi:ABC-2 type transport system ATP-binding protein